MCLNDVVVIPSSRVTFSTTFPINCGRGDTPAQPHVSRLRLGRNKGMLPSPTGLSLCQSNFMEIIELL